MRLWQRWLELLELREGGEALALFRLATALCVLAALVPLFPSGLVEVLWTDPSDGGYRAIRNAPWLIELLGGPTAPVVWSVFWATLTASLATALGLGGRVSALLTLQGFLALTRSNPDASSGSDQLIANALWLLVLSSSTATWSLDCRLRSGRWSSNRKVSAWPRYLVLLQLSVMYFSTGCTKLSAHWTPVGGFSALYYILQQPSWQRFDMQWVASVYPLTQIATAGVWLFELSSPLLLVVLYLRATARRGGRLRQTARTWKLRGAFALVGMSMHVTIFVLMRVGPFSWISLAFYTCVFDPDELRRVLQRLAPVPRR